jgi:hypothetical protein
MEEANKPLSQEGAIAKEEGKLAVAAADSLSNAIGESKNVAEEVPAGQQRTESIQDDDDQIEWDQVRINATNATDQPTNDASLQALKSELETANARIAELESQIKQLEENPVSKLWLSYYQVHGEDSTITGFFDEIKPERVNISDDEEVLRVYYRGMAIESGLPDDEIEDAVAEKIMEWEGLSSRIDRAAEIKKAKQAISSSSTSKLAEADSKWKKSIEDQRNEAKQWAEKQLDNLKAFVNKAIEKGKFNQRSVDRSWGDAIIKKALVSGALMDPDLVEYDVNGDIYVPDAIDFLDNAVFRKQLNDLRKSKINTAKATDLEQKAASAHNARIQSEIVSSRLNLSEEDEKLMRANAAAGRPVLTN